jgi:DNA polymerase-3 subunit alpha
LALYLRFTNTKISDIISESEISTDSDLSQQNDINHGIMNFEGAKVIKDGTRVILGGILSDVSRKITKRGSMMAFCKLSDLYGTIELIVFPTVLNENSGLIASDELVIVKGKVSIREDELPKIICESMKPLIKINAKKIYYF